MWPLNAAGYCWRLLAEVTGRRYPGFVELDLGPGNGAASFNDLGPGGFSYVNQGLEFARDHARQGGLVGYCFHHPYPGSPSKDFNACFPGRGQDAAWFASLTQRGLPNDHLRADLDWAADRLATLRDQRIAVLFRPYHEMNKTKNPFWWADREPAAYKKLWEFTYNYLTRKGLDNLLWVWSPYAWDAKGSIARDSSDYYPDQGADLVALDIYADLPYPALHYESLSRFNRPRILAETDKVPIRQAKNVAQTGQTPWVIWSLWAYTLWADVNDENTPNAWNAADGFQAVRDTYNDRGILVRGDPWPAPADVRSQAAADDVRPGSGGRRFQVGRVT